MSFWAALFIFAILVFATRLAYLEGYMDANNDLVKRLKDLKPEDEINNLKGE